MVSNVYLEGNEIEFRIEFLKKNFFYSVISFKLKKNKKKIQKRKRKSQIKKINNLFFELKKIVFHPTLINQTKKKKKREKDG